ncbi:hypothetical protein ACS0TY_019814 [Phlomoides rotata]
MNHSGFHEKALEFYAEMRKAQVRPDNYTFPSVINACAGFIDFEKGRVVHEHVLESGFESDLNINNVVIDMYARCDQLGRAQELFDGMPHRDIVSWNSLISGYTSDGYFGKHCNLVPDSFSFSSVLLSCGGLEEVAEGEIVHGLVEKLGTRSYVIVSNDFALDVFLSSICWLMLENF